MKKIVLIFLVLSIISCAKEKDTITSNKGNNNSLVVNQKKLQEIKNKDSQKKLSYYRELKSRMEKFEKNIQKKYGHDKTRLQEYIELSKKWDEELNIIYRKVIEKLKNSKYRNSEQILVTTQKAWIKYKESNYNFVEVASEMLHYNSAIKATVTQIALTEITSRRTLELAKIFDFLESNENNTDITKQKYLDIDKKLNEKYKNILNQAKIKKFDIEKFIESQRNWVELKEKEILFWNSIGNEKEKLRALTEMIENRILDFDSYLEDYIEEFE